MKFCIIYDRNDAESIVATALIRSTMNTMVCASEEFLPKADAYIWANVFPSASLKPALGAKHKVFLGGNNTAHKENKKMLGDFQQSAKVSKEDLTWHILQGSNFPLMETMVLGLELNNSLQNNVLHYPKTLANKTMIDRSQLSEVVFNILRAEECLQNNVPFEHVGWSPEHADKMEAAFLKLTADVRRAIERRSFAEEKKVYDGKTTVHRKFRFFTENRLWWAIERYMGLLHPEVLLTNNAITTTGWRIFGTYTPKDQNLNHPTYNIRS